VLKGARDNAAAKKRYDFHTREREGCVGAGRHKETETTFAHEVWSLLISRGATSGVYRKRPVTP